MDNVKNDLYYIKKLREDLSFIVAHSFPFLINVSYALFFIMQKHDIIIRIK